MGKNTIAVKNYLKIREEFKAAAEITPGMLVEVTANDTVQAHSDQGGNVLTMIAVEDSLQGKLISDVYEAESRVQVWVPTRGDIANMLLANGETVVIGDQLVSDGNGRVMKLPTSSAGTLDTTQAVVGVAVEAVDMSDSDAADPDGRILVRIA